MIRSRFLSFSIFLLLMSLQFIPISLAQTPTYKIESLAWNSTCTELALAGEFSGAVGVQIQNQSGDVLRHLSTSNSPDSVSWSADDSYVAATFLQGNEHATYVWDNSGNLVSEIQEIGAKTDYLSRWLPIEGSTLIATEVSGLVNIWDVETQIRENILSIPSTSIISIESFTWNHDGTKLLTISNDGFLRSWDATNNFELIKEVYIQNPTSIAISFDNSIIAVTNLFHRVALLDANTLKIQQSFEGINELESVFMSAQWGLNGNQIAVSSFDMITIFDTSTGDVIRTLPLSENASPYSFDYNSCGQLTYVDETGAVTTISVASE